MFQRLPYQIFFPIFLTITFVTYNMQQNQICLILLDVAGRKNPYFKDNLEKNILKHIFCNITNSAIDFEEKFVLNYSGDFLDTFTKKQRTDHLCNLSKKFKS